MNWRQLRQLRWEYFKHFLVCHRPGGSFIYWAEVTSHTCKANVHSTNTSLTWIDSEDTNHKRKDFKWRFLSEESLLVPSLKPVTLQHRSSLLCCRYCLAGFSIFHGSTRSDIKVESSYPPIFFYCLKKAILLWWDEPAQFWFLDLYCINIRSQDCCSMSKKMSNIRLI